MGKIRVFEAAKNHGCDVQDLLSALADLGIKARSHLSPVDESDIEKALEKVTSLKPTDEGDAGEPKVAVVKPMVRRRRKNAAEEEGEEEKVVTDELADGDEAAKQIEPETAEATTEEGGEAKPAEGAVAEEGTGEEVVSEGEEVAAEGAEGAEVAAETGEVAQEDTAPEQGKEIKEEDKSEFGLKVVRFIHTEPKPAPPPGAGGYQPSKSEREARRAEKKARKRKGRRDDKKPTEKREIQKTQITTPKAIKRRIRIDEFITVADLAKRMGEKSTLLIKSLMGLGIMATINQVLDAETATLVADEFGYEIENITVGEEEILAQVEDKPEDLEPRPPVVTVMGHVDHGKTSLLDAIRETRVAEGESGGITQHIGAYKVETSRGTLVFLDTPGHEAFTAMRARGAQVTDIVVLVVAADDGVMPQTVEAINHSQAAEVPIIVAVNKMDKADANPDRVKRELSDNNLIPEEWGGDVACVPVSAKMGDGIEELLEMIALQAELHEFKANPNKLASGIVVEARLDRGRGPVATMLVREGTLKPGDTVLVGNYYGRVRALTDDKGRQVNEAGPGTPVEITGLNGVPDAGEMFSAVETERIAKDITSRRVTKSREQEMAKSRTVTLEDLHDRIAEGDIKTLPLIVKADVQGSVEALTQTLEGLSTSEVKVKVIHGAVGGVIETDVNLAIASNAIIIGFHVRSEAKASALASQSGVDIRLYNVIYDATDDVKKAMTGLLAPTIREQVLGRAEVLQTFKAAKVGTIAGCQVTSGVAQRNANVRLLRENVVIYDGELGSLKRFKDDAKEVREGFECGLSIKNYNDLKVGDEVEFYILEEVAGVL